MGHLDKVDSAIQQSNRITHSKTIPATTGTTRAAITPQ